MMRAVLLGLMLGGSTAGSAAEPCPADGYRYPPTLASWPKRAAASGRAAATAAAAVPIPISRATTLALLPGGKVRLAPAPGKAAPAGSHAGIAAVTIERAGTYQVALESGAWVDLVRDGRAVASTSHGHGPDCSGIGKLVRFPLAPGRYLIQLSGAKEARIGVLVSPTG